MLHSYAGAVDSHGNELLVTEVGVADEIAAAADLVKGKLTAVPVAVVRGLSLADDGSTAVQLLRGGEDDLFWLGTSEALEAGRLQAQLLRRSVRSFAAEPVAPALIEAAVAKPSPHPPSPHPAGSLRVADGCHPTGGTSGTDERSLAPRSHRRREVGRVDRETTGAGQILYDAPEVLIPFLVPRRRPRLSGPRQDRGRAHHVHRRCRGGRAGPAGCAGGPRSGQLLGGVDDLRPGVVRKTLELQDDWEPLGAIAIGYPADPAEPRHPPRWATCWCADDAAPLDSRTAHRLGAARLGSGCLAPLRVGFP